MEKAAGSDFTFEVSDTAAGRRVMDRKGLWAGNDLAKFGQESLACAGSQIDTCDDMNHVRSPRLDIDGMGAACCVAASAVFGRAVTNWRTHDAKTPRLLQLVQSRQGRACVTDTRSDVRGPHLQSPNGF